MHEPVQQPNENLVARNDLFLNASRLWTALERLHAELNAVARMHPNLPVSSMAAERINELLQAVKDLIDDSGNAANLHLLDISQPGTNAEVLLLTGFYKGALRSFRMMALQEHPFSF